MDGLEAARRIIERGTGERPRIIALTADATLDDRDRCLAAGMDDYLTKPIRAPELMAALERAAQPAATLDAAAVDQLLETAGGDGAFVADLLDTFADQAPGLLEELRDGLSSGDRDGVRRAAHTLKSNAATFGATDLSALCASLERLAQAGDLAGASPLVRRVEDAYDAVREALAPLRTRLAGV